jgi:hypothetical protein
MSYRDDLEALRTRQAALDLQVAETTRQRDEVRRMVDEANARAKLPVLANISIASPCKASWDAMTGDDRTRMCAQCNKHVFNLSEMTNAEAEALIAEKAGRLCARYFQRADGTILLADCEIGAGKRRRRRVLLASTAAIAFGTGLAAATIKLTTPTPTIGSISTTTSDDSMAPATATAPDDTIEEPRAMLGQVAISPKQAEVLRLQELRQRAADADAALAHAKAEAEAAAIDLANATR